MCVPQRSVYSSGDSISGRYKVLESLGEGTFGTVYKVQDADGQTKALKLLKLWEVAPAERVSLCKRFDMEYETGRIESKYLVHSYSNGRAEGNPYIVMEFCPGGDLRSKRNIKNKLTSVGSDILCGLRDLHRCGKVHRDLKPDNVLFRADGTAVLTDFGISGDQNKRMTERGWLGKPKQIFGTYAYMPPEQVRPPRGGSATVLPTTDIFSFGVMMYELLVGRLPFGELRTEADLMLYLENGKNGKWDRSTLGKIKNGVRWQEVIEGCLIPDFHKRFQSADDVLSYFPSDTEEPVNKTAVSQGRMLLRVMQGEEYGRTYVMDNIMPSGRSVVTLGRQSEDIVNDISIVERNSSYISRRHCTIELDRRSNKWYIRDGQWDTEATNGWRNSLNGTFLNSAEVPLTEVLLHDGDIVSVGDVKLRVEIY